MSPALEQFLYKVAISGAVGGFMAAFLWPFRKARKEWNSLTSRLEAVQEELSTQRNNCLSTLQNQGHTQIELLGQSVELLGGVRLDLAEQTGFLRAVVTPLPRRRRALAKK